MLDTAEFRNKKALGVGSAKHVSPQQFVHNPWPDACEK